jgi:CRP-like cAMP-binding protein
MGITRRRARASRLLPDGSPLRNQLLAALPPDLYAIVARDLRMAKVIVGETLLEQGAPVSHVYFPNSGVYSVVTAMRDGALVEVAAVGCEGMLGVNVLLGDKLASGRSLLQVPDGLLPKMTVGAFVKHTTSPGPFRTAAAHFAQANVLQIMQCNACNVLHRLEQRCCRWLLQTHDRVANDDFLLKHEFLAIMLGTTRPAVTVVMGSLHKKGIVTSRYGHMRVIDRKKLERASCECYGVIAGHFKRLGLEPRPDQGRD